MNIDEIKRIYNALQTPPLELVSIQEGSPTIQIYPVAKAAIYDHVAAAGIELDTIHKDPEVLRAFLKTPENMKKLDSVYGADTEELIDKLVSILIAVNTIEATVKAKSIVLHDIHQRQNRFFGIDIQEGKKVQALTGDKLTEDLVQPGTSKAKRDSREKYKVSRTSAPENLLAQEDELLQILTKPYGERPEVAVDVAHTINTTSYLTKRIGLHMMEVLKAEKPGTSTDFFFGTKASEVEYYKRQGFELTANLETQSATTFRLYQRINAQGQLEEKIVLSGMKSEARVHHQIMQVHFAGVDVSKINIVGSLQRIKDLSAAELTKTLAQLTAPADDKILFIGNKDLISKYFKKIPGATIEYPQHHSVEDFVFDTFNVVIAGKTTTVAALSMPNGDVAYDATKAFLQSGFTKVVMVGAGGALQPENVAPDKKRSVGDYIEVSAAKFAGKNEVRLAESLVIPIGEDGKSSGIAVTVDSPLDETEAWLAAERNASVVVDVETHHILRAIDEINKIAAEKNIKVVSGMFVSDVVGEHPLDEPISMANAYQWLDKFLDTVMPKIYISFQEDHQKKLAAAEKQPRDKMLTDSIVSKPSSSQASFFNESAEDPVTPSANNQNSSSKKFSDRS